MKEFDENSNKAQELMFDVEAFLLEIISNYIVTLKSPRHDVARRFLNEINEFKSVTQEKEA